MFINLKELKNNPGSKLKLVKKSMGDWVEKSYNTPQGQKSFNICNFEVEQDGKIYELGASAALKRKLDELDKEDAFLLSYEEFTSKQGELRHYWKIDPIERTENAFTNYIAEVSAEKQVKPEVKEKVLEKSTLANNGARFGMIFNNTFQLYKDPNVGNCAWTTEQFSNEFVRVMKMVEACENIEITKPGTPQKHNYLKEQEQRVEDNYPAKEVEKVQIEEDDLPF
jgi:hypothetical protein